MTRLRYDVLVASYRPLPDGAPDDRVLVDELQRLGARSAIAAWDDPDIDWSTAATTVVRSTWNYHDDVHAWYRWLDRVAPLTRLVNAPATLRWNADKRYLLDLAAAAIPIVPTRLISTIADLDTAEWTDVIVKPTVGAGGSGARRFHLPHDGEALHAHTNMLLANGAALLQPFQPEVLSARERSLVFIGGTFAHAFTKPAFHPGLTTAGNPEQPIAPSADELALAHRALATIIPSPVYARVDLVPSPAGPLLMELELIEPHLAFHLHPETARALAHCLLDPA